LLLPDEPQVKASQATPGIGLAGERPHQVCLIRHCAE
jgi:hypothetical protein